MKTRNFGIEGNGYGYGGSASAHDPSRQELLNRSTLQLSLVACYGPKDSALAELIVDCQEALRSSLGASFQAYALEQVHGTIIGLEARRMRGRWLNASFLEGRGEEREMDFEKIFDFVRSLEALPLRIQIGGFRRDEDYGFLSRGSHPFERSFAIQGEIAVAMGWPRSGDGHALDLDRIRRTFQSVGVLHKWHVDPGDVDNDFYFVLGRVDAASIEEAARSAAVDNLRRFLAEREGLEFSVRFENLSIVRYEDTQLPPDTSRSLPLSADPKDLRSLLD